MNGYANKHNCRIWDEANSHEVHQVTMHPQKLRRIRENMRTWGIWAKLNINVEIVAAIFFSQIAVDTI